jgi:hypothetical protein
MAIRLVPKGANNPPNPPLSIQVANHPNQESLPEFRIPSAACVPTYSRLTGGAAGLGVYIEDGDKVYIPQIYDPPPYSSAQTHLAQTRCIPRLGRLEPALELEPSLDQKLELINRLCHDPKPVSQIFHEVLNTDAPNDNEHQREFPQRVKFIAALRGIAGKGKSTLSAYLAEQNPSIHVTTTDPLDTLPQYRKQLAEGVPPNKLREIKPLEWGEEAIHNIKALRQQLVRTFPPEANTCTFCDTGGFSEENPRKDTPAAWQTLGAEIIFMTQGPNTDKQTEELLTENPGLTLSMIRDHIIINLSQDPEVNAQEIANFLNSDKAQEYAWKARLLLLNMLYASFGGISASADLYHARDTTYKEIQKLIKDLESRRYSSNFNTFLRAISSELLIRKTTPLLT